MAVQGSRRRGKVVLGAVRQAASIGWRMGGFGRYDMGTGHNGQHRDVCGGCDRCLSGGAISHMIPVPKPVLIRDEAFRQKVRSLPCVLADREPCTCWSFIRIENGHYASQCAHVRVRRNGDEENCVPLCAHHHRQYDQDWGRHTFEAFYRISLKRVAVELWREYHVQ